MIKIEQYQKNRRKYGYRMYAPACSTALNELSARICETVRAESLVWPTEVEKEVEKEVERRVEKEVRE